MNKSWSVRESRRCSIDSFVTEAGLVLEGFPPQRKTPPVPADGVFDLIRCRPCFAKVGGCEGAPAFSPETSAVVKAVSSADGPFATLWAVAL